MKRDWPMILATVLIVLGLVAFLAGIYNSARDADQFAVAPVRSAPAPE